MRSSLGVLAPLGQHAGEVVPQRLGGGHAAVPCGRGAGDLDRPPLELRVVVAGKPEDAGDHLDREVEGELLHEVGVAPGGELVDQLVDHGPHQALLPALEHLRAEGRRDQGPLHPVLGLVHLQDGPPHHRAHHALVDRGREGLVVPQHLHALVEAEDGHRLDGSEALLRAHPEVDRPHVHRALGQQLGHAGERVEHVAGDGILELVGIEGDKRLGRFGRRHLVAFPPDCRVALTMQLISVNVRLGIHRRSPPLASAFQT